MARDDQVYSNPAIFDPDRYTKKGDGAAGEPFPTSHFGFGRRQVSAKHDIAPVKIFVDRWKALSRETSRRCKRMDRCSNHACNFGVS